MYLSLPLPDSGNGPTISRAVRSKGCVEVLVICIGVRLGFLRALLVWHNQHIISDGVG